VIIRWLDQAVEDLKAVRTYIARDNPSAAADIAQRIRNAVKILGDYPAAGRAGRVPNTRELVVAGTPYILPYRVRAESVEILRVLHGAQQWPEG
jgi:toxin ParE1/3/4